MSRIGVGCVLWLVATFCCAQQRVKIEEGSNVRLHMSKQALNRLAIEGDRISTVKGLRGQFELDHDTESGQIFLKPMVGNDQEVHLFLLTEKGYTYPVTVQVEEGAAQSIVLVPLTKPSSVLAQSDDYENRMKTFVQAMVNQHSISGFVREDLKRNKLRLPKIKHTRVKGLQSYRGGELLGQIVEVRNTAKQTLHLTEEQFYLPGMKAIAIVNPQLLPQEKTLVYVVRVSQ